MTNKIMYTVYSKKDCKYCETIERLFDIQEIPYTKLMLHAHFQKEEFIAEFGEGATFPRVISEEGKLIGGATETLVHLKEKGIL